MMPGGDRLWCWDCRLSVLAHGLECRLPGDSLSEDGPLSEDCPCEELRLWGYILMIRRSWGGEVKLGCILAGAVRFVMNFRRLKEETVIGGDQF